MRRAIIIQARVVVVVVGFQKVSRAHGDVMFGGMMFCEVIGAVGRAAVPVDMVLVLTDAVADPVETHVHSFGAFLFDGVVGEAGGCGVVSLDWRSGLWVAEFCEGDTEG